MKIEVVHVSECPHVGAARTLLRNCLIELQLNVTIEEKEGVFGPAPLEQRALAEMAPDGPAVPIRKSSRSRHDIPFDFRPVRDGTSTDKPGGLRGIARSAGFAPNSVVVIEDGLKIEPWFVNPHDTLE